MGIFDNVNWQQAMPTALAAFAGAADPRFSQQIGQSGWQQVQAYMQQQKIQQDQEQFQERMKIWQGEQQQREKQLKILEDRETRANEKQLRDDVLSESLGEFFSIFEKEGDISPSRAWSIANEKAKTKGVKMDAGDFMTQFNASRILMGDDGPVLFRFTGDGVEMTDKRTGKPVDFIKGLDEKRMKWILEHPELMLQMASDTKARGDREKRPELVNGASALRNMATSLIHQRDKSDVSGLNFKLSQIKARQEVERNNLETQFGKKDKDSGLYPGAPMDPALAKEHTKEIDKAYNELNITHAKEIAGLGMAVIDSPAGKERVGKELKKVDEEFTGTPEEVTLYREAGAMVVKKYPNMPRAEQIAMARAIVHGKRELEDAQKKKDDKAKPLSVKPKAVPKKKGEAYIEPVEEKFDWSLGGRIPMGGLGMNELGRATDRSLDYMTRMLTPRERPPRGWQGY